MMRKIKCSARMEIGGAFILILAFAMVLFVPASVFGSTANGSGVFFELFTQQGASVTGSGSENVMNFTVNNTNASLLINEINITVPADGGGDAEFVVDPSTISSSNGLWNCTNASTDGAGNPSLVRCNASSGNELVNGSIIQIWFNATAPTVPDQENAYDWNVTAFNVTAALVSKDLSFDVDGLAPTIQFEPTTTQAQNMTQDYIHANVTANDTYLDTITIYLYDSSSLVNSGSSSSSPFSQNFTSLPDEFYYLNASANDSVGNIASTATRTILIDTTPPTITIHSPENISYGTGTDIALDYSASDNLGLATCKYSIDSGSNNTLTGCDNTTITVGEGSHNITVYVQDTTDNLNSAVRYFTADLTAPSVTLMTPKNGWDDDGDGVYFYYKPIDALSDIKNCSLWLSGRMGAGWSLNQTSTTISNNQTNSFSVSGMSINVTLGYGAYWWNVQCHDNTSRSAFSSSNYSLYIGDRPNLMIRSITPDKSENPYVGLGAMKVNVTVSNNGTANVQNTTTVNFCFGTNQANPCDSGTVIYQNSSVDILASALTVNANHTITYVINITGGGGDYYLKATADSGDNETEQYDGGSPVSSIDDNSLIETFSTDLNVTVLSITHYRDPGSFIGPRPGEDITIEVSVRYDNGTPVDGLHIDNFTIEDRWNDGTLRSYTDMTSNLTNHSFTGSSSGIYELNFTVPGVLGPDLHSSYERTYAEYGQHYVMIGAVENSSGHDQSGTSESGVSGYNISAIYLRVSISSFDMDPGDPKTYKTFTVYNDGNESLSDTVYLTIKESPTSGMSVGLDDNNISASEMNDDGEQVMTNIAWFNPSAEDTFTVKLNASTTYLGELYWYTRVLTIDVENETDGDDGDGDGDDDQQQVTQYECTTNASCSSSKWCKNGECVAVICPDGYYASSHTCKLRSVYEVEIKDYKASLYVLQGGSIDTNVSVENTGNQDLTMMLEVEIDVDGINATIAPESVPIDAEETKNFSISFDVLEDAPIGNHTLKYKVTTSSTASDTVSFTFVVQPLAETIEVIKESYENYTLIIEQLLNEFNTIKLSGMVTGQNLTMLEAKVNATRLLFDDATDAMDAEDYIQVSALLDEIKTLVNQTRTLMEEFGVAGQAGTAAFWNAVIMWMVVGIVCIGAVGLLIYMLVPPQGYSMGRGYSSEGKGGILNRAKYMLNSVKDGITGIRGKPSAVPKFAKKTTPAYKSGYSKIASSYSPAGGSGIGGKFRKMIGKEE